MPVAQHVTKSDLLKYYLILCHYKIQVGDCQFPPQLMWWTPVAGEGRIVSTIPMSAARSKMFCSEIFWVLSLHFFLCDVFICALYSGLVLERMQNDLEDNRPRKLENR